MPGSDLHGSWEISSVPEPQASGGTGKVKSRNPVVNADEKSDTPVVGPSVRFVQNRPLTLNL